MSTIEREFRRLCKQAEDADIQGSVPSTHNFELHLLTLVHYCQGILLSNRDEVVQCFNAVVRGEIACPYETAEFCMHLLRLPEVLEFAHQWYEAAPKGRRAEVDRRMLLADLEEAYRDDWRDMDLWQSLSSPD